MGTLNEELVRLAQLVCQVQHARQHEIPASSLWRIAGADFGLMWHRINASSMNHKV